MYQIYDHPGWSFRVPTTHLDDVTLINYTNNKYKNKHKIIYLRLHVPNLC